MIGVTRKTVVLAAVTCALYGCRSRTPERPVYLIIGLDTSTGERESLGPAALLTARLAGRLDPEKDRLTVLRVGEVTEELYDDPARESAEELQRRLVTRLRSLARSAKTLPVSFWREAALRGDHGSASVAVVLFSDGNNAFNQRPELAEIHANAKRLEANPNVACVAIIGVDAASRAYLRDSFSNLGDRLLLRGSDELDLDVIAKA